MSAKAIVTTVKNGTRFFLTETGVATDIIERAKTWNYGAGAHMAAVEANCEREWQNWGFHWEAANLLYGGVIV